MLSLQCCVVAVLTVVVDVVRVLHVVSSVLLQ